MSFIIHPYRKFLFWIKAITFGMFYMPIFYGVLFSDLATIITLVLVMMPLALLLTWLFVRDRVFTFQDHTLTIKSALDFYPFNRLFKKKTFDFDQIDRITLEYSSGRYWGVWFILDEKGESSLQAETITLDTKMKELKGKRHSYFLNNVQRQNMFKWEAILQDMQIKVEIKN